MIRMSEGIEANAESFGSIENKDDPVAGVAEQPTPAGVDIAADAAAPGDDHAGLPLVLCFQSCFLLSCKFWLTNI